MALMYIEQPCRHGHYTRSMKFFVCLYYPIRKIMLHSTDCDPKRQQRAHSKSPHLAIPVRDMRGVFRSKLNQQLGS